MIERGARQPGKYADEVEKRAREACEALALWAKAGFTVGIFGAATSSKVSRIRLPSTQIVETGFSLLEKPGEALDGEELDARISYMEDLLSAVMRIQNEELDARFHRAMAGIWGFGILSIAWLACIIGVRVITDSEILVTAAASLALLWAAGAVFSRGWERRKFDAIQNRIEPGVFLPWLAKAD